MDRTVVRRPAAQLSSEPAATANAQVHRRLAEARSERCSARPAAEGCPTRSRGGGRPRRRHGREAPSATARCWSGFVMFVTVSTVADIEPWHVALTLPALPSVSGRPRQDRLPPLRCRTGPACGGAPADVLRPHLDLAAWVWTSMSLAATRTPLRGSPRERRADRVSHPPSARASFVLRRDDAITSDCTLRPDASRRRTDVHIPSSS